MATPQSVKRTIDAFASLVIPWLRTTFAISWRGEENLRGKTGVIIVANHLTVVDPLIVGHFVYKQGLTPHFMAKDTMFRWPVLGPIMKRSNQVPVVRGSSEAAASIAVAREIVEGGEALIVYPEGTLTQDPGLWPMRGYSGAARLAIETGALVIPVVHWGDQRIFATRSTKFRPRFRPRLDVAAGTPVDLSDLRGQPISRSLLTDATERIMSAITSELAALRGETPPAERFDPRKTTS